MAKQATTTKTTKCNPPIRCDNTGRKHWLTIAIHILAWAYQGREKFSIQDLKEKVTPSSLNHQNTVPTAVPIIICPKMSLKNKNKKHRTNHGNILNIWHTSLADQLLGLRYWSTLALMKQQNREFLTTKIKINQVNELKFPEPILTSLNSIIFKMAEGGLM